MKPGKSHPPVPVPPSQASLGTESEKPDYLQLLPSLGMKWSHRRTWRATGLSSHPADPSTFLAGPLLFFPEFKECWVNPPHLFTDFRPLPLLPLLRGLSLPSPPTQISSRNIGEGYKALWSGGEEWAEREEGKPSEGQTILGP